LLLEATTGNQLFEGVHAVNDEQNPQNYHRNFWYIAHTFPLLLLLSVCVWGGIWAKKSPPQMGGRNYR